MTDIRMMFKEFPKKFKPRNNALGTFAPHLCKVKIAVLLNSPWRNRADKQPYGKNSFSCRNLSQENLWLRIERWTAADRICSVILAYLQASERVLFWIFRGTQWSTHWARSQEPLLYYAMLWLALEVRSELGLLTGILRPLASQMGGNSHCIPL